MFKWVKHQRWFLKWFVEAFFLPMSLSIFSNIISDKAQFLTSQRSNFSSNGYGSIPINTIFRGMNIHFNPAILMFTRGTYGFDTLPNDSANFPSKATEIRSTTECFWVALHGLLGLKRTKVTQKAPKKW